MMHENGLRWYGHVLVNSGNDWVKMHRLWCGRCKTKRWAKENL